MRKLLALLFLLSSSACLRAQDQELVNRLLRPNMSMENSAQNKHFTTDKKATSKSAYVKAAYIQEKENAKPFKFARDFSTGQANSWAYNASGNYTNKVAREKKASTKTYGTSMMRIPVGLRDGEKVEGTNDYPGSHKFTGQGKSQKSLNRKNKPMTIEQVRELLNKNK